MTTEADDTEPVCGESYDHDLRLIDERDGSATYECRDCGAEVLTEPGGEEAAAAAGRRLGVSTSCQQGRCADCWDDTCDCIACGHPGARK